MAPKPDTSMIDSAKPKTPKGPWLLEKWNQFYLAFPKIYIPFTNLEIGLMLFFAVIFSLLRYVVFESMLLIQYFGWPEGIRETREASGSVVAMTHSLTLVPALLVALWSQPYVPSSTIENAPVWYQNATTALLQFCTAYMIYDSICSFVVLRWDSDLQKPVFTPADWMFLGHHFATAFYMTSTRVIGAGHISAMICMAIGEFTNPIHNLYLIFQYAVTLECCKETWMPYFDIVEFAFAVLYVIARTVVGPLAMLHISYDVCISKGRKHIPIILRVLWLLMIWGVVFGSIPWIEDCIGMVQKQATKATAEL